MVYILIGTLIAIITAKYGYCLYQGLKMFIDKKNNGHA